MVCYIAPVNQDSHTIQVYLVFHSGITKYFYMCPLHFLSSVVLSVFAYVCLLCMEYSPLHFILFIFYKFIYFWLRWVFVAACRLSLVAASRGYSSLWCTGFSLQWLLLLRSMGSRCAGFSSCGSRALERRLSSCGTRA